EMDANLTIPNGTLSNRCPRDTRITQVVFPLLYTGLFIVAVIFNILAGWIFFRIPATSTFIVYLKNIVAADLAIPFKIVTDARLGPWQLKAFVCRFSAVIFYTTMYISITLLGLISFDRYLKIVRPMGRSHLEDIKFAKIISAIVWLVLFSLSVPNMILTNKEITTESVKKCALLKSPLGLKWHEVINYICQVIFWGVFALMIVFYSILTKKVYESYARSKSKDNKAKRKAKGKVFIILAVFFTCFAPFHFCRVPYTLSQTGKVADCTIQRLLYSIKESTLWLSATNTCLDPFIYIFLCKSFREILLKSFKVRSKCVTLNTPPTTSCELS
uniref:Purinergic receptor P2Y13 n=1 Tax=Latimeria chalumnae TaxID=7897 RepID=H3AB81_LATCH